MTKQEKAQAQLDAHFLLLKTVTTLDLKNELIANWPEETWTQQWVSGFMQDQDLNYVQDSSRRFRIYEAPVTLTLDTVKEAINLLIQEGHPVTKVNIRRVLTHNNFPLGNFQELFAELNLQHVKGNYTSDNHKIWTVVPVGKHLSQSKGTTVDISTMPKKYLMNAINRYVADNDVNMFDTLSDPNRELHKLLKAFFTHDIRNIVNQ